MCVSVVSSQGGRGDKAREQSCASPWHSGHPRQYPETRLVVPQAAQCLARAVTARCHATESWFVFMTKEEGREGGGGLRPGEGMSVCRG